LDSSIKTQTQIHNGETTKPTEQNINLKVSFHSLARNQCKNLVPHGIRIRIQQNLQFSHSQFVSQLFLWFNLLILSILYQF